MEYTILPLGSADLPTYRRSRSEAKKIYDKYAAKAKELEAIAHQVNVNDTDLLAIYAEMKIWGSIVSDLDYCIEWMRTGRRPGNRRGIERRSKGQREVLMDPLRMQAYVKNSKAGSPTNLTDWQRYQIEDALSRLSPRERECYILAHGECFSFGEIANMIGITKASVQDYVDRAQRKISQELQSSLFLFSG